MLFPTRFLSGVPYQIHYWVALSLQKSLLNERKGGKWLRDGCNTYGAGAEITLIIYFYLQFIQSWNPLWSVASILTGLVSFMMDDALTTRSIKTSDAENSRLAETSPPYNCESKKLPALQETVLEYVESGNIMEINEYPRKELQPLVYDMSMRTPMWFCPTVPSKSR